MGGRQLVLDPSKTQPLEEYWSVHCLRDSEHGDDSRPSSSSHGSAVKHRARVASYGTESVPLGLSSHHPALALPASIFTFGPLLFPLYKAALLRKRILLMHQAPVELACNFVYNISILSNIPSSVIDLIPLEPLPTRLQPLFSVGVHDIDELSGKGYTPENPIDLGFGWIACSTDDVLAIKTDIYDILVNIPPSHTNQAKQKIWPQLKTSTGQELKASQRDLRRYRTLRHSIEQHFPDDTTNTTTQEPTPPPNTFDDTSSTNEDNLTEPTSWSALAYNSFMWWASAGEKTGGLEDEIEHDASMFRDFNPSYTDNPSLTSQHRRRSSTTTTTTLLLTPSVFLPPDNTVAPEMAIIAFFHRLTANIFTTISKVVEEQASESESERGESGSGRETSQEGSAESDETAIVDEDDDEQQRASSPATVYIGSDDLVRMGLDVWSEADKKFVAELVELYWGRKADVQGGTIECCGVRII